MSSVRSLLPLLGMALGLLLGERLEPLKALIPMLISGMLFFTFLGVKPWELKLSLSHLWLLAIQLTLVGLAYGVGLFWGEAQAEAFFICILAPAASAGPTIVAMLGGDTPYASSYTLLSHAGFILIAPLLLPYVHPSSDRIEFFALAWDILLSIVPIIVPPILLAWYMVYRLPRVAERLSSMKQVGFILWVASVILLMGHTVHYLRSLSVLSLSDILNMLTVGLISCLIQFIIGYYFGRLMGVEPISTRQSLGQKNTSLVLWISTLYLSALSPLAVAAYIFWQNLAAALIIHYSHRKISKASSA